MGNQPEQIQAITRSAKDKKSSQSTISEGMGPAPPANIRTFHVGQNNFSALHHPDAMPITEKTGVKVQQHVDDEDQVNAVVQPPQFIRVRQPLRCKKRDFERRYEGTKEE